MAELAIRLVRFDQVAALVALILACVVPATGCNMPRDPDGTLDRVRGNTLRAGVAIRPPWTRLENGKPAGVEVTLLNQFAKELNADIVWTVAAESELMPALEHEELDIVICGLTDDTPWKDRVGITKPYLTSDLLVGVRSNQTQLSDIDDQQVGVPQDRLIAAAYIRKKGGTPVWVDAPSQHAGPMAADRSELQAWGFTPTDIKLHSEKHVMAVPMGENDWLVHLERYLFANRAQMQKLLGAEASR